MAKRQCALHLFVGALCAARRRGALVGALLDVSQPAADLVSALLPGDHMISRTRIVFAASALSAGALLIAALSACGTGGASEPPQTSYDPAATSKVQFAVGVATLSYGGH